MRFAATLLFAFHMAMGVFAGNNGLSAGTAVPGWIDTVPPKVEVLPKTVYHSSVFMITLSANKRTTFYVGQNDRKRMQEYKTPISVTRDTTLTLYFYGEDDLGNKSRVDSMRYVLDRRPPRLAISPERGYYQKGVVVKFSVDKPCRFEFCHDPGKGGFWKPVDDSVQVTTGVFEGFVAAIDSAGNRSVSGFLKYVVDTTTFKVTVDPAGGIFNKPRRIALDGPTGVQVFLTFDPLAPPEWFKKYDKPVAVPSGLSVLRFYGKNASGRISDIRKETYILDTVPPRIQYRVLAGSAADTLFLSIKKKGDIHFTLDGTLPSQESPGFKNDEKSNSRGISVVVPHVGKGIVEAIAWDEAGNESDLFEWERKYDTIPPVLEIKPAGGLFNRPFTVFIVSNKHAKIYYSNDGSKPTTGSLLQDRMGIAVSREGETVIKYFGLDDADNKSEIKTARFTLDTRPPTVKVQIEGTQQEKNFLVRLLPSEPATIYYETTGTTPTEKSALFRDVIPLQSGQTLSYFAVDSAGNKSEVFVMDELKKPRITASPEGGSFNHRVTVKFLKNLDGTVFYRFPPDTAFRPCKDSLLIKDEGLHTLEYYLMSNEGLRSPLRRNEYYTDWTPPKVTVSLKKGVNDSVSVFFESNKNASIYYTIDGTNPLYSAKTFAAGNKYMLSHDRVSILRKGDVKLAFYAEDVQGNQSAVTILDVLKPRVVPNVPASRDHIYDRLLSIDLNTYDQANIYYARHGHVPTLDSAIFKTPITLIKSDTITAFAVDASGFRGDPDTLVYRIDLPPSPHFIVGPDTLYAGSSLTFDASSTIDNESPLNELLFRWDFTGDGHFDTRAVHEPRVAYTYSKPGKYDPTLEVTDPDKHVEKLTRTILVREHCPSEMVSVADDTGRSFCIDRYEWPNGAGKVPETNVSWVEAKIACIDAGKRLCTRQEWQAVCRGGSRNTYPYGDAYDKKQCATEGAKPYKSGTFKKCGSSGVYDMVGNVWEWVEDKQGDYPVMMGGSYNDGKDAHCDQSVPGTMAAKAPDAGFRCCK